ncbi:5384_t:CDS:2 [Cetraspora pellucida]|uniref:5384_t:CDS:1 n=1 Tax=Cetraspora pellucida TaxID=1433469 RepID=A0ACA9QXK0_9GLOM|nr:5384_t:CDS:2 [Cetraspora pellucida]
MTSYQHLMLKANLTKYINYNKWYHANTNAQLSSTSAKCFPKIDHTLKEYLTEEMLF